MKSRYLRWLRVLTRSLIVISLAVGFTSICVGSSIAAKDANKQKAVESFVKYGFDPEIPGAHATDSEFILVRVLKENAIKRFGQPANIKITTGEDRYDSTRTFEAVTLEYPGLSIHLTRYGDYPKGEYEIGQIILTSPQYRLQYGLSIGQPKARFFEKLGPTETFYFNDFIRTKDKVSQIGYSLGREEQGVAVVITFDANDLATSISWYQLGGEE